MVRELTLDTNESEQSPAMGSYKQDNIIYWSNTKKNQVISCQAEWLSASQRNGKK